ncbi:MAG: PH domain-containing protein, partial [Candidatus Symbiothrix sp.]|nr:PH domain-containing protein [Candidatus Symbiothrix sp.]
DKNSVQIHQIKGGIAIPLEAIKEIRLCDDSDTKASIRKFGSGGAFGYLGKFENEQSGNYQMYVTDASKEVIVKTADNVIVFSCEKPEELIRCVSLMR